MPSSVDPGLGWFDRFAGIAEGIVSRAPFFAFCVAIIVAWPVSFWFFDPDTAQLIVNTATTIVTFLLVSLLANSEHRSDLAVQHKLNAIADALAEFMDEVPGLATDVSELRAAVGIEQRESSTD